MVSRDLFGFLQNVYLSEVTVRGSEGPLYNLSSVRLEFLVSERGGMFRGSKGTAARPQESYQRLGGTRLVKALGRRRGREAQV